MDEMTKVLTEISQLTTALRQGGPDPMDLQELSDALELATGLAHHALAAQPAAPVGPVRSMELRHGEDVAAPPPSPPQVRETYRWRHKKRGTTYVEIGRGNLQIATDPVEEDDRVVIYRSEADGRLWVRGEAEFQDGRFEAIAALSVKPGEQE